MSEAEATLEWLKITQVVANIGRIEADTEFALVLKEGALFENANQLDLFFKIGIGFAIGLALSLIVYSVVHWFLRRKYSIK